jgi:hypothetical protein
VAQPTHLCLLAFEAQTKKQLWWFWGTNHQTVSVGFEAQSEKPATTGFEVKPEKTVQAVLRLNHWQTVPLVLRSNHWQTVKLGFEAQPRNPRSSSPCARYRPYTASLDLSIIRLPSTQPVCNYLLSFTLGLILLPQSLSLSTMPHLSPAHHEISKHNSPHEQDKCSKTTETVPNLNSNLDKSITYQGRDWCKLSVTPRVMENLNQVINK